MMTLLLILGLTVCLAYGIIETINHWSDNDDTK
jgi:hypothetical protein